MGKVLLVCAVVCLTAGIALADPLIVQNLSPTWIDVSSLTPGSASFVMPAVIPGCGSENNNTCEPTGVWIFNQTWVGAPSKIVLNETDAAGAVTGVSDVITFDSLGPHGEFRIQFFSDPDLPGTIYDNYITYAEVNESATGAAAGPYSVCCIINEPGFLSVMFWSDAEVSFDPLGVGYDTSDAIQFTGATPGYFVPEPGSMVLLVSGLGLVLLGRRRRTRN